jgi:oligopeptide transport system permease protein
MQQRGRSVVEIISSYLPVSVELGLWALALALALGLGTGIVAGLRQNSFLDYSGMSLALVGISVPTFVVGPLLILLFARKLHLLDSGGWVEWHHVLLPAVTLALPFASRVARLARAGMLEIIGQDFIRTARAKGMPGRRIVLVHALRGAILPVVSFLGPGMAQLLTGSLVVEQIFGIPGLGNEFVTTALNRDYPVVLGTVITYGTLQILFNLAVDLLYGVLDPRIRYA